jgi:hypothetical protein
MNSNSSIQSKSDLKVIEFDLENPNLFDIPLSNSNQTGGSDDNDMGFDDVLQQDMNREVQINQKLNSIRDYELGNIEEHDLIGGSSDILNQSGGSSEDPQLFDQIVKKDDSNLSLNSSSSSILEKHLDENPTRLQENQQGGFNLNVEGMEIQDFTDSPIDNENPGNYESQNLDEDLPNADDDRFDTIEQPEREVQRWVHPELTIENNDEMIIKMSQEDINSKVDLYLENYNSDEYQSYIKYFNAIYKASNQKYSIRKDNEGNIYLIKRVHTEKEKENLKKKTKESVYDVINSINNKDYMKDYLIKLTPPKYLNIHDELKIIKSQLNILSGEIKILQNDLIELGSEITNEDVKKFQRLREKFYKLINKKYIYSKYYDEVNQLFDTEVKQNIYATEIVSQIDKNDMKFYKLKYHLIKAPETLINNITNEIKTNLENYSEIILFTSSDDNKKEYTNKIKNFLNSKKENEVKIQNELNNIILNSKNKINYIIKKLPKLDIKTDIL